MNPKGTGRTAVFFCGQNLHGQYGKYGKSTKISTNLEKLRKNDDNVQCLESVQAAKLYNSHMFVKQPTHRSLFGKLRDFKRPSHIVDIL